MKGLLSAVLRRLRRFTPGVRGVARRMRALPGVALITPLGAVVLLASVAAWLAAATVGWIELLLAASTGLLLLLGCVLFTLSRAELDVELIPTSRRFTRGTGTEVAVRVRNRRGVPLLPIELEVDNSPEFFSLNGLAGHGEWSDTFGVLGEQRGVIQLGPVTSVRGDPIGLLERRKKWTGVELLYVHPQTTPLESLGSGLLRDLEGRPTNELSMSDLAFHTLREYAPGDDSRYIHWGASAKSRSAGGKFLVRQFQDTRRTQILVVVDGNRGNYTSDGEFELAIEAGASIAVQAVRDELEITVFVADRQVRKRSAALRVSRQQILDACSMAKPTRMALVDLVSEGVRHAQDLTYAVVVTGGKPLYADVGRAVSRVPGHVRTIALQCKQGATSAPRAGVLQLGRLADLKSLLDQGEKS